MVVDNLVPIVLFGVLLSAKFLFSTPIIEIMPPPRTDNTCLTWTELAKLHSCLKLGLWSFELNVYLKFKLNVVNGYNVTFYLIKEYFYVFLKIN